MAKKEIIYRKPIQVPERTNKIIKLEAARQTIVKGEDVSMGKVVEKLAEKINMKHKHVKVVT